MEKKSQKGKGIVGLIKFFLIIAVLIIAIFIVWKYFPQSNNESEKVESGVSSSQLEKVLHISELSTYNVTFNGVATIRDESDKVLYHVAYDAKVSVGLDMEKIKVEIDADDEEKKKIVVILPEIEIKDVNVDPSSLDYIFIKKDANTDKVFVTAYPACKEDAENECKVNNTLFKLARENAVNVIKALVQPLLEEYEEYSLKIVCEGGYSYE